MVMKIYKTLSNKMSRIWLSCALIIALSAFFVFAAASLEKAFASSGGEYKPISVSGQELEKPKPVFTRNGDEISAKYIPRAKSTSVTTTFKVSKGGKLVEVKGKDFEEAARPEVDIKNYKSALFIVEIGDVSPAGSDATLVVASDFFASGTEYRVFNERLPQPWFNSECHNVASKGRVRELLITIKDGGPFDSDGAANGSITFVGGPRDSFWGYALGTLFIRFFGIFLVLSVLMIGMMLSGVVFSRIEAKKADKESDSKSGDDSDDALSHDAQADIESEETQSVEIEDSEPYTDTVDDYEIAAAISTALHLYFESANLSDSLKSTDLKSSEPPASKNIRGAQTAQSNTWSNDGRAQMMRDRLQTYNRGNR
ncbi:MAG: OadG family protein [Desulfamplus sp.]